MGLGYRSRLKGLASSSLPAALGTVALIDRRARLRWCLRTASRITSGGGQGTTGISTVRSLRALTDLTSRSVGPTSHPDHTTESTTSP